MARSFALALVLVAALAGCIAPQQQPSDDPGADPGPGSTERVSACQQTATATPGAGAQQSGVSNQPGSFSYGGQVAGKSATEVYLWENAAQSAQVVYGGQAGTGMLKITIADECGEKVYEKEMSGAAQQSGSIERSTAGDAGTWAITFEFALYTGQMGVQISSA